MSIITLATDYGNQDGYSGAAKGVLKALSPESEIVEITDELTTILKASLVLYRYYSFFPSGTIHLVVIDPTVGGNRRALAGSDGRYMFVGPDNGVFTRVISAGESAWFAIDPAKIPVASRSSTFHGRDIFAPLAAMLSGGISIDALGHSITDPVLLPLPLPVKRDGAIQGEVIDIDKFGNLITNILEPSLIAGTSVMAVGNSIPFRRTFADVEVGMPLAYIGSLGFLEIAVNQRRADRLLNLAIGDKIEVLT